MFFSLRSRWHTCIPVRVRVRVRVRIKVVLELEVAVAHLEWYEVG